MMLCNNSIVASVVGYVFAFCRLFFIFYCNLHLFAK